MARTAPLEDSSLFRQLDPKPGNVARFEQFTGTLSPRPLDPFGGELEGGVGDPDLGGAAAGLDYQTFQPGARNHFVLTPGSELVGLQIDILDPVERSPPSLAMIQAEQAGAESLFRGPLNLRIESRRHL
jgi:hypothetical protein